MIEFKSFKEFFEANPIAESKLSDFSKDKFPFEKFFVVGQTYIYPVKFNDNGSMKSVFADDKKAWIADITKSDLGKWNEISSSKIPKDIKNRLMNKFKPLQN